MQQELPISRNLQIVRLENTDAKRGTDYLGVLRNLILLNEGMYPDIGSWWSNKVVPGLATGERTAFVGYDAGRPIVSAVVKRGGSAKFCHLKLSDEAQDSNLGEVFFALMALEVRHTASSIHFTLPESLWAKRKGFFSSFSFYEVEEASTQYRLGERELRCEAPFATVWSSVLEKLPKLISFFSIDDQRLDNRLLLSIQPRWAESILSGRKTVEVRRKFSGRWVGRRISLYASKPVAGLVGQATILDVVSGPPAYLWDRFGVGMGCSKEHFDNYTRRSLAVQAILLTDVSRYPTVIPLTRIQEFVRQRLRPPQSHLALHATTPWGKAVSIACMLSSRYPRPIAF
jgi:predicted transcriptional regulator